MTERIGKLIRTNVALTALCIIAISAVVSLFRGHEAARDGSSAAGVAAPAVSISGQPPSAARAAASGLAGAAEDPLAHSPLRNMPAPSSYRSFAYAPGTPVSVSGKCADAYRVVMVFPADVDYRADPLSAVYNDAAPCDAGRPFVEHISLDGRAAIQQAGAGARYYVVRASEGKTGSWYGPY